MLLYGLKNCDTCRKARAELSAAGHDVIFRDVRADPLSRDEMAVFHTRFGDRLLNRASTTWRGLSEAEKADAPLDLLARHSALMKRPLIERNGDLFLGWTAETRQALGKK